jgi:hypothetical protein
MRMACCLALAALLLPAAQADAQDERALVVVLPHSDLYADVDALAGVGLHVAVASPAVNADAAGQTYLDVSQGARVSARVYDEDLPKLGVGPGGQISGWDAIAQRAADAPADLVPGLLAETIAGAGGSTAFVGVRGRSHQAAAIAADASGRVDSVALGTRITLNNRVERALQTHPLVVAEVPPGPGLTLFPRKRNLLVIVLVAPPAHGAELLPTGAGFGGETRPGLLTSSTTRRDGMVAITDYAPTVLRWLGLTIPDDMQGRPMRATGGSPDEVESLANRLAHIKGRRDAALRATFGLWVVVLGLLALAGRARLGLRLGLLVAIWLPGLALLTGASDPSRGAEIAILALGSLALAVATDRLVPWPRAPALAAGVVLGAHAVDLIAGSPLIVQSLAGPNPGFGARFYGVGNELEAILSATVLLGAGALLAGRRGNVVPVAFAVICAVAALFIGAGRLGADVGGVITLGAGAAAAVLASLPGGISRRAVVAALLVPGLAFAALALIDVVTGGDSHLTRSVLAADSPGELVDIIERRFDTSWESLKRGTTPLSVGLFALALGYGVVRRREVFAPLGDDRAFAAGMWGTLAATVVGALANDSGPTIFLIGATALVLAAAYVSGKRRASALT